MSNFTVGRKAMICSSAEAESRKYFLYKSKKGRKWLVADQPNAGDNVYVEGGPNSEGFAGRTLTFPLVNGEEVSLQGPWHTTSNGLFAATGVDVRDKCLTFGVISHERKCNSAYETEMIDVIYQDEKPIIGTFDRVREIAQKIANKLGKAVFCYSESKGGSSCGQVKPEGKNV